MSHPAFTLVRQARIPSLNIVVEEYRHLVTNARHLHLVAEDNNNAFLVAFLTVPQDSTGVAHILEHTTLCGSRHYPVRDPFFMMIRRSLNTFMNAFTSSDWTAYPFASQNTKDFNNLLRVYLDAVFFPNLNELDFAQEGHRLEFEKPDDPTTPLVYKGVVFNEMKGAMSSPIQRLLQTVHSHLFPTITYHYNSGGDPHEIPKLTHAQLRAFHASHYHPTNAILMTYGDRPAAEHQQLFEECALQYFQALQLDLKVPDEQRYDSPQQVLTYYPVEPQEAVKNKTHIVLAWLLGRSTDLQAMMNASLLAGVLLNHSASPLRHVLETTSLGTAPSPLCGLDDNTREASFMCGLEGSNLEQADEVETMILQVLEMVAAQGIPPDQVESVLHQIELSQREITGDHFPYGLHLLVNALSPMIHGGDPVAFLDVDPVLVTLRENCQDPSFISNLIRNSLLDNPHRVRVVMTPDPHLAGQQLAAEQAQLAALQANLSAEEKNQIMAQTVALQTRQQQQDDPELLPKVGLADVPDDLKIAEGNEQLITNQLPVTWFTQGTNGMVYQNIVIELPQLEEDLVEILPLFCDCLTEVGCGNKNYLEMAAWQAAVTGGIHARISMRSSISDLQTVKIVFSLFGKALARNQQALANLLQTTLDQARFDELPRLRELIAQLRVDSENSITGRGHHLVMTAASSKINPVGYLNHRWHGLAGLQALKKLDKCLENEEELAQFTTRLERIRTQLQMAPRQWVVVSEAEQQAVIANSLAQLNTTPPVATEPTWFQPAPIYDTVKQAWSTHTQINFCAKVYPTVPVGHDDAPVLMVLADFLRNGYLHRALREQGGAYGGGANYDGSTGSFRLYSYRDPRLMDTLTDFDQALVWLQNTPHEPRSLEEAILGVIARIDRPGSPAGEAISSFFNNLHGRTPTQRREFRRQILQVQIADLTRVAATYLLEQTANIAVLSDTKTLAQLPDKVGLEYHML
ncbi:peptidase M16 [Thioploca ingrica]|uniref:Peptidase M16 n=1 Tax=Thioploca ingrica TaxID=40754 RepID=A0A090ALI8_9GAMM|nr:peptidase M16 [Thioploca ingrica]